MSLIDQLQQAILDELDEHEMTQVQLAELSGLTAKHINQMLNHGVGTLNCWDKLAECLGFDWQVILI